MRIAASGAVEFRLAQDAFANRRIPECLALLNRVEELGYSLDQCDAWRWNCWMLLGRFEEAWRVSGRIIQRGCFDPNRLWDGQPFANKRVIIRCLHGFGDAIQFLRYARLMRRSAATITAQTHPQLVGLLRGIPFLDRVITWGEVSEWDQQIEVMELPRAFRTTIDTVPARVPYLFADRQNRLRSVAAMDRSANPRVGLLWEGGDWNPARNVPLREFLQVLAVPGVEFYSFQRGGGRDELISLDRDGRIHDLSGDSPDVSIFAADLTNMDLLITVDTMAAHLAGALGKPVWVLLPYQADWRWMLDRCDSPWYPTMRLFRQTAPGDWRRPIARAAAELEIFRHSFKRRRRELLSA